MVGNRGKNPFDAGCCCSTRVTVCRRECSRCLAPVDGCPRKLCSRFSYLRDCERPRSLRQWILIGNVVKGRAIEMRDSPLLAGPVLMGRGSGIVAVTSLVCWDARLFRRPRVGAKDKKDSIWRCLVGWAFESESGWERVRGGPLSPFLFSLSVRIGRCDCTKAQRPKGCALRLDESGRERAGMNLGCKSGCTGDGGGVAAGRRKLSKRGRVVGLLISFVEQAE